MLRNQSSTELRKNILKQPSGLGRWLQWKNPCSEKCAVLPMYRHTNNIASSQYFSWIRGVVLSQALLHWTMHCQLQNRAYNCSSQCLYHFPIIVFLLKDILCPPPLSLMTDTKGKTKPPGSQANDDDWLQHCLLDAFFLFSLTCLFWMVWFKMVPASFFTLWWLAYFRFCSSWCNNIIVIGQKLHDPETGHATGTELCRS